MGIGISTTVTDVQAKQINQTKSSFESSCPGPVVTQSLDIGSVTIDGTRGTGVTIGSQGASIDYECLVDHDIDSVSQAIADMDAKTRAESSAGFLQSNINTNTTTQKSEIVNQVTNLIKQTCDGGSSNQDMSVGNLVIRNSDLTNSTLFDQNATVKSRCKLSLLTKLKTTTQQNLTTDTSSGGNIITTLITSILIVAVLIASAVFAYKFANSEGGQKVIQAGIEGGKMAAGVPPGL